MCNAPPEDPWYRVFDRVYAHFHGTVRRCAARLISPRLRRRVDEEDIAQSVFRTFHRRNAAGECDFDNTRALCSYLLEVTRNKVQGQASAQTALKCDMRREVDTDRSANLLVVPALQSSPADSAALRDEFEYLTRGFSQRDLEILQLCCAGHNTPDIATITGCTRWTVRRVLNEFGSRWQARDRRIRRV